MRIAALVLALGVLSVDNAEAQHQDLRVDCPSLSVSGSVKKTFHCYDLGDFVGEISFTHNCYARPTNVNTAFGWYDIYYSVHPIVVSEYTEKEGRRHKISKWSENRDSSGLQLRMSQTLQGTGPGLQDYCSYTVVLTIG